MAISASKSTTIYAPASSYGYTLSVSFTENSTNTTNNTSNITINASLYGKNIGYSSTTANNMKIYWIDNGGHTSAYEVNSKTIASLSKGSSTSLSGTINVYHKADGKLNGYARVVFTKGASNSYVPPTTTLNTANTTLTTIPRATSCPAATLTVGKSNSVTISPASTSFNHTASFKIGSRTFTANAAAGSKTLTFNLNDNTIYSLFSTAKTTATATLTTKSGSTNIGSKTATWTIQCDANLCRPSVTATYLDSNSATVALTGDNQTIVKGVSNASITMNPTTSTSTITKVTVDGVASSDLNHYTINGINKNSVAIIATDARGFSSATTTMGFDPIINYVTLTCNPTFERNTPTDGKVKLNMTGNYYNGSFGDMNNSLTITYQYKESSASTYGTAISLTPTLSGNTYSYESADLGVNFDYTKSYDFKVNVSDAINSFSVVKTVSKGEPMFWVNDDKFVFNSLPYYKTTPMLSAGVVLFENLSGANGNITLSDSAANYEYFEIFYKTNDNDYSSVKVYQPNGKYVCLHGIRTYSVTPRVYGKTRTINISGNTITTLANTEAQYTINNSATGNVAVQSMIYIIRVIGYVGSIIPSEINAAPDDSGWINLTATKGTWNVLRVRRIGDLVYLEGDASAFTWSGSAEGFATIPAGYRPAYHKYIYGFSSGKTISRVYVSTGGSLGLDWLITLSNAGDYTSQVWFRFYCVYAAA